MLISACLKFLLEYESDQIFLIFMKLRTMHIGTVGDKTCTVPSQPVQYFSGTITECLPGSLTFSVLYISVLEPVCTQRYLYSVQFFLFIQLNWNISRSIQNQVFFVFTIHIWNFIRDFKPSCSILTASSSSDRIERIKGDGRGKEANVMFPSYGPCPS